MYDLEKISNIPIREVAERLGLRLKKRKANYFTNCLWHDDEHPSMVVGGKYNRCHCYSCDADYGVLDLVMKANNMDFKEACEWLEAPLLTPPRGRASYGEKKSKIKKLEALQARHLEGSPSFMLSMSKYRGSGEMGLYFKDEFINDRMNLNNSFAQCLVSAFGKETATRVVSHYWLGSYEMKYGYPAVMFPLIDKQGRILDIKVQSYDCNPQSPTFFHKLDTCFWLKSVLMSRDDIDKSKIFTESSPPPGAGGLFGEHLLNGFLPKGRTGGGSPIILVESPKNACVGAAKYPEYLWLATGNKGMLKRELLEVLRGRDVIVFPDNDAFDEWNTKLKQMQDITFFACMHVPEGSGEKGDIADWILGSPPKPSQEEGCLIP